jgi:hypothetical protein
MSNPFEAPRTFVPNTVRSQRLTRIGILSSGLFGGAILAAFGLFVGGMVGLVTAFSALFGTGEDVAVALGMAIGMLLMAPLMYGIFGFLGGVLGAFVYNLVAGMTGGIELEFTTN